MRSLTSTLKAAQEAMTIDALVKIVLTKAGQTTRTYTRDRILDKNHPEEPYSQKATVVLDNSDGALTNLDLQGFKGVISYGAITSAGEEYSSCAPLWVISQQFESSPGKLDCTLELLGIPNLMAEDKASASYMPESTDTKTVKTLINEILGATLACFSHCQACEVVWEDGYDTLADTYKPKDSFRIYAGSSRLVAYKKLLNYTGNVARVESDGKWHIFKPTTSGEVYDSQYSLESGHTFFSKAYRKRVVIPGYIVVKSQPDDAPQYSGFAKDAGYDDLPAELKKRDFQQMRLESNAQATAIAEAILSKHQLWSELGAFSCPVNVGQEVFDYVKVIDEREEDYRVGNLGRLTRHYNAEEAEWRMSVSFGNWMTVRKALAGLDSTGSIGTDDLEEYFSRLRVKNLYVEYILAENCAFAWIDPDNTIDLSKIGDNLDSLPDGTVYARVKSLHLDAGQIKLDENIVYKPGYDPTTKEMAVHRGSTAPSDLTKLWLDTSTTPNIMKRYNGVLAIWERASPINTDEIGDGITYARVKKMALSTDGLILIDQIYTVGQNFGLTKKAALTADGLILMDTIVDGTYGRVKSAGLSATGLVLLDQVVEGTYGRVAKTDISAGHIKLSTAIKDGIWYKESGVKIDAATGITIYGTSGAFRTRATETGEDQCYVGSDGKIYAGAGAVILDASGATLKGSAFLIIRDASNNLRGYIGGSGGLLIQGYSTNPITLQTGGDIECQCDDFIPLLSTSHLGDLTHYWDNVYGKFFRPPTTGGFIFNTTHVAEEGSIKVKGAGSGDIYVYSNGAWRANT